MAEQKKGMGCFGLLVVLVAAGWLIGQLDSGNEPSRSRPSSSSGTTTTTSSAGRSDIVIHANASRCLAVASEARIYVFIAARNRGNTAGSIDVLPVRRYSDGTRNESVLDVVTLELAAGETKTFRAEFDYNALQHDLLECWLRVIGSAEDIRIAAEQTL